MHVLFYLVVTDHNDDHVDVIQKFVRIMILVWNHVAVSEGIVGLQRGRDVPLLALDQLQRGAFAAVVHILYCDSPASARRANRYSLNLFTLIVRFQISSLYCLKTAERTFFSGFVPGMRSRPGPFLQQRISCGPLRHNRPGFFPPNVTGAFGALNRRLIAFLFYN